MKKTIIFGAGGQGKVVLDILNQHADIEVVGFLDGDNNRCGQLINGVPILGGLDILPKLKSEGVTSCHVAIGNNHERARLADYMAEQGFNLINAIHPTAIISSTVSIGTNTVVAAGAIICVDVQVGSNVIVNTGVIVDHENVIEDNVHISPGAKLAGRVKVGQFAHVGIGASIIQNITIGSNAVVGAGAVVIRDVSNSCTVVGVPAQVIKQEGK